MKALEGTTRAIYLGFFASHIVFTLIVDVQAIAPSTLIPMPLRQLLAFYLTTFKDPLFHQETTSPHVWFQALVACEMMFQLPFFVVACYQLLLKQPPMDYYPEWFRYACIAYGSHTATTMAPILTSLATSNDNTNAEKRMLLSLYMPYLVLPVGILWIACTSDNGSHRTSSIRSDNKEGANKKTR